MARNDQVLISVPRSPEPGVEGAAAALADRASMLPPIVVDMIERQKLDMTVAAAAAADVALTIVEKREVAILT